MEAETQEASQESEESAITDEMLDRAADGVDEVEEVATEDETTEESEEEVGEEVAEEETEEVANEEAEVAPEEPEDNAERSRLGRRVSELEGDLLKARQESQASADNLNETLKQLTGLIGKKEDPVEEEFFELPETKADLTKLIKEGVAAVQNEEVTQQTEAAKAYESGYIDTVESLLDGEDDSEAIIELIQDEFNIKHSKVDNLQSGVKDAAKNIMAARSKLLQGSVKKVPLKGEKPRAPLGGGGGDKVPVAAKKRPVLDATAEQYVKDTNMSDDDVIKMFG